MTTNDARDSLKGAPADCFHGSHERLEEGLTAINPVTAYLVYPFDPFGPTHGGGVRYLMGFARNLPRFEVRVHVVGLGMRSGSRMAQEDLFGFIGIGSRTGNWLTFFAGLMRTGRRLGIPRGAIIHVFHPLFVFPVAMYFPRNPIVCTVMGQTFHTVQLGHPIAGRFLHGMYRCLEALALRRADIVMVPGEATKVFFEKRHPYQWLLAKTRLTGSGVDTDEFQPKSRSSARARYNLAEKDSIVMFAGRMEPIKNLNLLLESFMHVQRRVPNAELVLVGDGSERPGILNRARSLGLRCKWLGLRPPSEMADVFSAADTVVLCSHSEASPTVLKEALACGVPVVSTDAGDAREVIVPGVGLISEPTDVALSDNILQVLVKSRDLSVREACRRRSMAFTMSEVARQQTEVYRAIFTPGKKTREPWGLGK